MRFRKTVALLIILLFSLQASSCASASRPNEFSEIQGKDINRAMQSLNSYAYQDSLDILDEILEQHPGLTPYEKSTVFELKGMAFYEIEKTPEAINAFENAIKYGGLPTSKIHALRRNIALLWIINGNHEIGANMLEQWVKDGNELKSLNIEILLEAWIQSENYERALPWAIRWYDEAETKERKHFDLMNFLYNKLDQPEKHIEICKDMIERWPDDKTLRYSLASLYSLIGQEREAFMVMQESYRLGMLNSEREIISLVKYYSYYQMPNEAARIFEIAVKDKQVSQTFENKIRLSSLYQNSGDEARAAKLFAEAVDMRDEKSALKMKQYLAGPELPSLTSEIPIPDFHPPKRSARGFKIRVSDRDARPLVRIPPHTPETAEKSGHCRVSLDVDIFGNPENVTIIYCTQDILALPSIVSVKKWRYNPKVVNGRTMTRSGVEDRVSFQISN